MFSSRAHSAVHFARCIAFATFSKQARLLSVSNLSYTKGLYSESILLSEKQRKVNAKCKRKKNKKLIEESKLYPDELQKLNNFDVMDEIEFMDDDDDDGGGGGGYMVSLVEPGPIKSEGLGKEFVPEKKVKIPEAEKMKTEGNDLTEKLSDSDSESDTEDNVKTANFFKPRRFLNNLDDLKITSLPRRSEYLRSEIEKASSNKYGMAFIADCAGIFELAKKGITPTTMFFCSFKMLSAFPAPLSNIDLYRITFEDCKYWAPKVKTRTEALMGLYEEENLRSVKERSEGPKMPLTVICDQIRYKVGFSQIMNSASVDPPKLFISSKECANPWCGSVLRYTRGSGLSLNYKFDLTWDEIRESVSENDRIFVLRSSASRADSHGNFNEVDWPSVPSVNLYEHNFWDQDNITLIVMGRIPKKTKDEAFKFCLERRNVYMVDVGTAKDTPLPAAFDMVFFEVRRQWLAMKNRKSVESRLKKDYAKVSGENRFDFI